MFNFYRRVRWPKLSEIKNYYPEYLKAHTKPWTRRWHAVGNLVTIAYLILVIHLVFLVSFWYIPTLLFTPFVIYFFAWPSHKYIEHNQAATFTQNPLITKACDQLMMWDMLRGKL